MYVRQRVIARKSQNAIFKFSSFFFNLRFSERQVANCQLVAGSRPLDSDPARVFLPPPSKLGLGFWLITPSKIVVEPKVKHHRNPFINPRWYTFCSVKVKFQVDPEIKVRSHALRTWIALGKMNCISVDLEAQREHSGAFVYRLSISIRSEVIDEKRWWTKKTPVMSSVTSHKVTTRYSQMQN